MLECKAQPQGCPRRLQRRARILVGRHLVSETLKLPRITFSDELLRLTVIEIPDRDALISHAALKRGNLSVVVGDAKNCIYMLNPLGELFLLDEAVNGDLPIDEVLVPINDPTSTSNPGAKLSNVFFLKEQTGQIRWITND